MSINSRSKGQRGEREVRDILQKLMDEVAKEKKMLWAPEIKRNLMQSMEGGFDLVGIPGLAVEVKFCETLQIGKWWQQTVRQADKENARPVLFFRQKNRPWRVVMNVVLTGTAAPMQVAAELEIGIFLDWFYDYLQVNLDKNV